MVMERNRAWAFEKVNKRIRAFLRKNEELASELFQTSKNSCIL
jgi:hypothetical protein